MYGINNLDSELVTTKKLEHSIKFEVKMYNFRAKGLDNKVFIFY